MTARTIEFNEQPHDTTNPTFVFLETTVSTIGTLYNPQAQGILAGSADLQGPVSIFFSNPVTYLSFEAGWFDEAGSTVVQFRGADGKLLKTQYNTIDEGQEFFTLQSQEGIYSVSIMIDGVEPAGFCIDQLIFDGVIEVLPPEVLGVQSAISDGEVNLGTLSAAASGSFMDTMSPTDTEDNVSFSVETDATVVFRTYLNGRPDVVSTYSVDAVAGEDVLVNFIEGSDYVDTQSYVVTYQVFSHGAVNEELDDLFSDLGSDLLSGTFSLQTFKTDIIAAMEVGIGAEDILKKISKVTGGVGDAVDIANRIDNINAAYQAGGSEAAQRQTVIETTDFLTGKAVFLGGAALGSILGPLGAAIGGFGSSIAYTVGASGWVKTKTGEWYDANHSGTQMKSSHGKETLFGDSGADTLSTFDITSTSELIKFNPDWYLDTYADAKVAVASGEYASAYVYYITEGIAAGHSPNSSGIIIPAADIAHPDIAAMRNASFRPDIFTLELGEMAGDGTMFFEESFSDTTATTPLLPKWESDILGAIANRKAWDIIHNMGDPFALDSADFHNWSNGLTLQQGVDHFISGISNVVMLTATGKTAQDALNQILNSPEGQAAFHSQDANYYGVAEYGGVWVVLIAQTEPYANYLLYDTEVAYRHGTYENDMLFAGTWMGEIDGDTGNDSIIGGGHNDTLIGSEGEDTLLGGGGSDYLTGGEGVDIFRFQSLIESSMHYPAVYSMVPAFLLGYNVDQITDFEVGIDKIDLRGLGFTHITSNSATALGQLRIEYSNGVTIVKSDQSDFMFTLLGNYQGLLTDADFMLDSALPDGSVALNGGTYLDTIVGTAGEDIINGHGDNDILFGDAGNDILDGGTDHDLLFGGAGNDLLLGGSDQDSLMGGVGADTLDGGGNDPFGPSVWGNGDTVQYLTDTAGVNVNLTHAGPQSGGDAEGDIISNIENIDGGAGNDTLTGSDTPNRMEGNAGDDIIFGAGGDDYITGGEGNDFIDGGDGDDFITVYSGTDYSSDTPASNTLLGGAGNDSLVGSAGSDVLIGGAGSDNLSGGPGDDIFRGGAGDDRLTGNAGADTFVIEVEANATDTIVDFTLGEDIIDLRAITPLAGIDDLIISDDNGDAIIGLGGGQTIRLRNMDHTTLDGAAFVFDSANDAPVAVADSYEVDATGELTIAAIAGVLANDSDADGNELTAILVSDVTHGTLTLNVDGSFSYIHDGSNNYADSFTYKASDGMGDGNAVTVSLDIGHAPSGQQFIGTTGNDHLTGSAGDDTLYGGGSADLLTGGAGEDVFRFSLPTDSYFPGDADRITDFEDGIDTIDLTSLGFSHITTNAVTQSGELRVEYSGGLTYVRSDQEDFGFRLNGDYTANLTDADFIFSGSGNDGLMMVGTSGGDVLTGGTGNDTLHGGGAADLLTGGNGADIFNFDSLTESILPSNSDRITDFEDGVDRIDLSGLGFNHITTDATTGADELRLEYSGGLTYVRSDQEDFGFRLNGDYTSLLTDDDFIFETPGSGNGLVLNGGSGGDTLTGGTGDDTLTGGSSADLLTGGAGTDVFVFSALTDSVLPSDSDRITDFEDGVDIIDLTGLGFSHITSNATTEAGELRLEYSGGITYVLSDQEDFGFRLNGNHTATLTDADFIF